MPANGKPKLVDVEWLDSKGVTNRWEFLDDLEPLEPSRCRTVGFLLEESDDHVTIVQTMGGEQVLGRITIPARAIIKQRRLR